MFRLGVSQREATTVRTGKVQGSNVHLDGYEVSKEDACLRAVKMTRLKSPCPSHLLQEHLDLIFLTCYARH